MSLTAGEFHIHQDIVGLDRTVWRASAICQQKWDVKHLHTAHQRCNKDKDQNGLQERQSDAPKHLPGTCAIHHGGFIKGNGNGGHAGHQNDHGLPKPSPPLDENHQSARDRD